MGWYSSKRILMQIHGTLHIHAVAFIILMFCEYSFVAVLLDTYDSRFTVSIFALTYKLITYGLLLLMLASAAPKKTTLVPAIVCFIIFSVARIFFDGSLSNTLFSLPIFLFVFHTFRHKPDVFMRGFYYLLALNIVLVFFQMLGVHEYFYVLSLSSPDPLHEFSFIQNDGYLPHHQHRPHGMFASTIQLSLFKYCLIGMLLIIPNIPKIVYSALGVFLIISGSITGLLLFFFCCFLILIRKDFWCTALSAYLTLILIHIFLPDYFVSNFSVEIAASRIESRLFIDAQHSFFSKHGFVFQKSHILYIIIASAVCSLISFLKFGMNRTLLFSGYLSLLIMPLINHPLFNDMRFSFLVAFVISGLYFFKYQDIPDNRSN